MRRLVLAWKKLGLEYRLGSRIVTYADELVILCKRGKAEGALQHMREIMGEVKLTSNEEKTQELHCWLRSGPRCACHRRHHGSP
jgi:RNA-directed DNA polymerase